MRVALVHECIAGYHGSERVLAALAELYPDAPVFTLIHQRAATRGTPLEHRDHRTSLLDRWPVLRNRHRLLLPLMPYAVEQHDLRGFDVVVSSHHAVAHGVITRADQLHVAYTHSPARYAWDLYHEHLRPGKFSPVKRWALHRFRQWDMNAGRRVDRFIANSQTVARRIGRVYGKSAEVIPPPVETARFDAGRPREDFYVTLGRLVPYKNTGAVVEAFNRLGRPLVVIGDGPQRRQLQAAAKGNVTFEPALSDDAVADHLQRCKALVFAAEEDFGMAPVEAMSAGAAVVALRRGGATETVDDGQTGVFFAEPASGAIVAAVEVFERDGVSCSPAGCRTRAERFDVARFKERFAEAVERYLADSFSTASSA